MRVTLSAPTVSIGRVISREMPYYIVSEAQAAVGLALVPLLAITAPISGSYTLYMVNRSVGGQSIRIGAAPSFAPAAGIMLLATDDWTLWNITSSIFAIADGAGALLDVSIWYQN